MKRKIIMKKLLTFLCLLTLLNLQGCWDMWNDEKSSFAKNMLDLQGGDLRFYQSQGLMFQVYSEPLRMADRHNEKGEVIGREFAEAWMKDSSDRLNHNQIQLVKGNLNQKASIIFNEFAQEGSWWTSHDLSKIFITTDFFDFHRQGVLPANKELGNARIYKMFKSTDGGQTFKSLNWPKSKSIVQILFDQIPLIKNNLWETTSKIMFLSIIISKFNRKLTDIYSLITGSKAS